MNLDTIDRVFFVGIGGIGMSALARFFHHVGKDVAGYDRTSTRLTSLLEKEGMQVHYADDLELVPLQYRDEQVKDSTLIIYTPAIPDKHSELNYFREKEFNLYKRAQVLGLITKTYKGIAVAGSHGKSTLSAMVATILHETAQGCSAFLGAISKNFDSNLLLANASDWAVMEADEFDRSFLQLEPHIALVTSMDPDHLDVYGAKDELKQSFVEFLGKVHSNSKVVIKHGLDLLPPKELNLKVFTYGFDEAANYYPINILPDKLGYTFDLIYPDGRIDGLKTIVPGWINVENAVGAAALSLMAGASEHELRKGIANFAGVKRRFDVRYDSDNKLYIDDYAHHPMEIRALLTSIRKLFPNEKILGVFQPHLFTRTRDFAEDFGEELSKLDQLVLLDIYPAREEPIAGVSSELILDAVSGIPKQLSSREDLVSCIRDAEWDVLLTIGAGDIDLFVGEIETMLNEVGS